ncbi:hypothetical protein G647_08490 [Cladophialophora carrionii CBS 160.54]|uniref:Cytochrome b561 domain-containing protein n=1 Tax=Cladophialophora carrionii CBS 160.54 TaxID=1279043 RepID=V9D0L5_9EURO|nr:uncharacterized protein G647_08490 [Cladophialophora carrionii CBS 160.54]ETI20454.1 hypothetical protein G647_08490 [Cladophialophora carrionii CBS 160.54]
MSPSPQLAPPGSSTYNSDTMHVGDGTWDAGRDNFLLPPLVGLNFATVRYNGMGNRFFTLAGYHGMVEAHGIIAAITFLGIVPLAIFLMRFYGRNPRLALRLHIWLQILTLLLTTVVIILGFQAVGPNRSLTNPHHGIGVAIYVLVWVQIIGGCMLHRREKGRRRLHIPLTAMLHHWLGRGIALLGITQVALGLTLYGSPQFLFVLYSLWGFFLLVLYFILQWMSERRRARYGNDGGSYYSDEVVQGRADHGHTGMGKLAVAGAAGAGLAALWRRRSSRRNPSPGRSHADGAGTEVTGSGSSYFDEKMSDRSHHGIGHRLLQVAAIGGAIAAVKKIFDRRTRDDESDVGPYRPPLGGNQSVTSDSMSRIEEGRPPPVRPVTPGAGGSPGYGRPTHPLAQPPMTPGSAYRRHSESSSSYDSFVSGSPSRRDRRSHTFRDAVAAGGAVFAVRQLFKNRRQRKEELRAEQLRRERIEQEKVARMNSRHRYTGDGVTPPRRARHGRMGSQTASDLSTDLSPPGPGMSGAIPAAAGAGVGAAAASALASRHQIRPVGQDPPIVQPGQPYGAAPVPGAPPIPGTLPVPEGVPPIPPPHLESSGSELYTTGSGRQRHRHHLQDEAAAGLAGAALGAAAADGSRRRRHSSRNNNTDSMESPPVSVKINMHNEGGRVTLRRLTEEEAASQRRKQRQASAAARRHRRGSSVSASESEAGPSSADRRWRRTEALEAEQAAQNEAAAQQQAAAQYGAVQAAQAPVPPPAVSYPTAPEPTNIPTGTVHTYPGPLPPPPPIPGSASNLGYPAGSGVTSPGTETSGATEYANNRRRRRAERAQARLAKEGRTGASVEFT